MPRMLTKQEVVDLIEQQFHTEAWNVCMIGVKKRIEGTEYVEIALGAYHQKNVKPLEDLFKDVTNVNDIHYIGPIKALSVE